MKTKTVGEILREARLRHRVSVSELAQLTRIRRQHLLALEANQFTQLPAATFVKGYIKTYARIFGFDHQSVVALLRRDFKESARGKLVPRDFIKPVLKRRQLWRPVTYLVLGLGLVFVSLVSYVGVQWYQLHRPPNLTITQPEENSLVAPRVEITGQTEPEAVVSVNHQPVALQPDGSFQTQLFLTREGLNTISVEASDRRGKTTLMQRTVRVKF